MHPLIRHSINHFSKIHLVIHSLIHSFMHSFIHSFIHSLMHSFIRSIVSLTLSLSPLLYRYLQITQRVPRTLQSSWALQGLAHSTWSDRVSNSGRRGEEAEALVYDDRPSATSDNGHYTRCHNHCVLGYIRLLRRLKNFEKSIIVGRAPSNVQTIGPNARQCCCPTSLTPPTTEDIILEAEGHTSVIQKQRWKLIEHY